MVCRAVDINNPYLWIFLTGLFAGAGFGRLPFLYGRNHTSRETGTAGWIFISAAFSLAVFSAVSSVFFPAGGLFGDGPVDLSFLEGYDWLFLILAGFIFGFLIRRFPRAAGIPLVILSAAIIFFSFQAFRSWSCYEADEEILRIRIAAEGDVTAAKFTFPPEGELLSTIQGRGIVPVVDRIECNPVFFFLGNGRLFRINGILLTGSSGRADDLAEGEAVPFMSPYSKGFFWGDLLAKTAGYLPFLGYSREIPQGRVPELNEIFILFFDGEDRLKYEPLALF